MATTFLQATNKLLREYNEVELSASNFSSAVGIHATVKDAVNESYLDIVNDEEQWPFLIEGNPEEPFRGSLYVESVIGQQWYLLKTGSADIRTDFKSVDWDTFHLTDYGVAGASAPYEHQNLNYMDEDRWSLFFKEQDIESITSGNNEYNLPSRVIRSADTRYFGLSPIPDAVYRIYFSAWTIPTALVLHSDQLVIPDRWVNVLYAGARVPMWGFKADPIQVSMATKKYEKALGKMRTNLIDSTPDDIHDDRIKF